MGFELLSRDLGFQGCDLGLNAGTLTSGSGIWALRLEVVILV